MQLVQMSIFFFSFVTAAKGWGGTVRLWCPTPLYPIGEILRMPGVYRYLTATHPASFDKVYCA